MSKLKAQTIDFMRSVVSNYIERPIGIFLVIDKEYPNSTSTYSVVLTTTTIAIVHQSGESFIVNYPGKTSRDVAREINNCPFPIEVRSLVNVKQLEAGEIFASGIKLPYSFDVQDISMDGKGAILRTMRYMISYKRQSALRLGLPAFGGPNLPWWPRVSNAEFVQLHNATLWTFGIPEYNSQSWSKTWGRPFRDVDGEVAKFINANTIKLSRFPILWRGNNIVLATPADNGVLPSKIVEQVDEQNGILYLKPGTVVSQDILVHYTYYEANYLYNKLDINAHFTHNPSLLNSFILFFARPFKSSLGASRQQGIYHIEADSLEAAIGSIPPDTGGFTNSPIALLGAINIRPSIDRTDISVLDTRSYGGGIADDPFGYLLEDKMVRSNLFCDIARKDGIPYGGSAAVLLELPSELKEVMDIDEIKSRAKKFLAAGVYPVTRFSEEDYYSQFKKSDHNVDIALIDYKIQNVIDEGAEVFGESNSVAYWIDDDLAVPTSGVYGNYGVDNLGEGPRGTGDIYFAQSYTHGYEAVHGLSSPGEALSEATSVVSHEGYSFAIAQDKSYYITYLRSSATPVFSYEERSQDGPWTRKTVRDESNIGPHEVAAGKLRISSDYGVKYIRNFTGFAGYNLEPITGRFWTTLGTRCANIFSDIRNLTTGEYGVTTLEVPDVSKTATALKDTHILPGVDPLYEPWLKYYSNCTSKNFYSGSTEIGSAAAYNYDSTNYSMADSSHVSGSSNYGSFPRKYISDSGSAYTPDGNGFVLIGSEETNAWNKDYEVMKDLAAYSRYSTARSNERAASGISYDPSILVPNDEADWITTDGDAYAQYAHSGALNIANRIHFDHYMVASGWYGGSLSDNIAIPPLVYNEGLSDIIAPIFNANLKGAEGQKRDQEDLLLTGYGPSESDTSENELYKRSMYIEAFAAFYATMLLPSYGEKPATGNVYAHVSGNPRNIAMAGIAMCNETFLTGHFNDPTYRGTALEDTWLTRYNRLSKLGSIYTTSVTNAYDSLYYGNKEWAGYKEYEVKTAPYYHSVHNADSAYQNDTAPDGTIKWHDGTERDFEDSLKYALSGLYTNMTGMQTYIEVSAKRGGMFLPGSIDLIRSYIWMPTHSGNGDVLFDAATNEHLVGTNFDSLVRTFEIGMAVAVKGCFGEDGILKEGGSFKGDLGPYESTVPSTIFKACGDAINYYTSIGDKVGEYKWTAIAQGLFSATERLHNLVGGYPDNPTHGLTDIAGDVGAVPLDGYLYLLGAWTGAYTDAEFMAITGASEGRL